MNDGFNMTVTSAEERHCVACGAITMFETEYLPVYVGTPVADQIEENLEALADPELHLFTDDCRLEPPSGYTKDDLLERPYEVDVSQQPGRLQIDIDFKEHTPVKAFEVELDVGGDGA